MIAPKGRVRNGISSPGNGKEIVSTKGTTQRCSLFYDRISFQRTILNAEF